MKLKKNLCVSPDANILPLGAEMALEEMNLLHDTKNEEIKKEIEKYIESIGKVPCDEVEAENYFNTALLMGELDGWKLFASRLGLDKITDIQLIENQCKVAGTDNIMSKIIQHCKPRPTWGVILTSLLSLNRLDILSGLLEEKILSRIKEPCSGYFSLQTDFSSIHQNLVRQPVEMDDSETSSKLASSPKSEVPVDSSKKLWGQMPEMHFEQINVDSGRSGLHSLEVQDYQTESPVRIYSCPPSLQSQQGNSIPTVELLTPDYFSKTFSGEDDDDTNSRKRQELPIYQHNGYNICENILQNNSIPDVSRSGLTQTQRNDKITVFLTYSTDAKRDARDIKQKLKDRGFTVITPYMIMKMRDKNPFELIKTALEKSHLIVVVLSRKYIQDIHDTSPQSEEVAYVRWIHGQYVSRYVNNGCWNVDIRVLRLPEVTFEMRKNLDVCLQNAFPYPEKFNSFVRNLKFAYDENKNLHKY